MIARKRIGKGLDISVEDLFIDMAGRTGSSHPQQRKTERSDGERPVVHIAIVCGLWQGASYSGAHPVFCFI